MRKIFPNTSHKRLLSVEQLEGYTNRSRFWWCSCSFYYLFDLHFEGVVSNSGGLGTAWLLKRSCIWTTSQLVFSVTLQLQLHGLGMAWKNLPLALCTSWSFSYLEVLKPFTDLSQFPKSFFPTRLSSVTSSERNILWPAVGFPSCLLLCLEQWFF